MFRDPFRPRSDGLDNILVMCDTYTPAGEALPTNTRAIGESSVASSSVLDSTMPTRPVDWPPSVRFIQGRVSFLPWPWKYVRSRGCCRVGDGEVLLRREGSAAFLRMLEMCFKDRNGWSWLPGRIELALK